MKKKTIIEYKGTKAEEKYSSKSTKDKHEKKEGKKEENREEKLMAKKTIVPKGSHRMPNGKIMKDSAHKKVKKK